MSDGACLNCGTRFGDRQKFCGTCGQRTDISPKLTLRDIGHDLAHALTHADHSIFALIRALATRPGVVAREYTEGKRQSRDPAPDAVAGALLLGTVPE